MPYKSAKQRAYLHVHEPEIAARWDREGKVLKKTKEELRKIKKKREGGHG